MMDCLETQARKPNSIKDQVGLYSTYKSRNTIKTVIVSSVNGNVTCVKNFPGWKSGKYVTIQSGYLDTLRRGDEVLGDRSFLVENEFAARAQNWKDGIFLSQRSKTVTWKKTEGIRRIANDPIHIERVIGVLCNRFKILNGPIPIQYFNNYDGSGPFCDKVFFLMIDAFYTSYIETECNSTWLNNERWQ